MRNLATSLPLLLVVLTSGCAKRQDDRAPQPAPSTVTITASGPDIHDAGAAAVEARIETLGVHNLDDPNFGKLSLFGRLAVERENRPPETVTADAVFDAVAKELAITLKDKKQLAGFPVRAGYAERANTDLGVNLVVTEYWDAAALAKGKDTALKSKTERRDIVTVKKTWVSITRFDDSPEAAAQAKKIAAVIKKLG